MRRPGQQPQSLAQQQPPPHPKPPQTSIKPSSEIYESSEPAAQSLPPRPAMGRGMLIQKLLQSAPSAGTLTSPMASMSIQPKVPLPSSPPTKTLSSPPAKVPLPPSPPAKVPLPPSPTEVKGSSPPSSKVSVIPAVGKEGSSGKSIPLGANYLVIQHATDHVFQYVVTYNPPVESKNMRYAMLNEHKDLIGNTRAFDGSILFLPIKVTDTTVTRSSKRATDGVMVKISITLTNMLLYEECIQLFNIIIRRVLRTLDMQQVGRHYFDKHHPISVPQHKMELWPGYVTSIHEFDGGLLLLLDISHKLLRTDTALDFFAELYANHRNTFRDEATRQLVGSIVMTRYNNKTYRVDDICWDKNPQSTFTDHTGRSISFIEYYKTAYGINIKDIEQPLLLHRPKVNRIVKRKEKKDSPNEGQDVEEEGEKVICLIPELCSMTGLTDNARNDFRVMKVKTIILC
jgi:aubergine-like protein